MNKLLFNNIIDHGLRSLKVRRKYREEVQFLVSSSPNLRSDQKVLIIS